MTQIPEPDRCEMIVYEILNDVDVYQYGAGPEGPWWYRSLRVHRVMNQIRVYDVDGNLYRTYSLIEDQLWDTHDCAEEKLQELLDAAHEQSLEQL